MSEAHLAAPKTFVEIVQVVFCAQPSFIIVGVRAEPRKTEITGWNVKRDLCAELNRPQESTPIAKINRNPILLCL